MIGGTLHYFLTDEEDKTNYTAAFVWPLLVPLAIGEWIGQWLKIVYDKYFKP